MKKKSSGNYFRDDKRLQQIGAKIRQVRQEKNMTQEALAIECEVDTSQINRMELGKANFSISYLYKVASALKVDPKDLLP